MVRCPAAVAALPILACLVTAAPVPKEAERTPFYYPTQVGVKRVYRVTHRGQESLLTKVVTAAEARDETVLVTESSWFTRETDPKAEVVKSYSEVRVSDEGVFSVETKAGRRWWTLRVPAKVGKTWENVDEGEDYRLTETVGKSERVKVPAGTFDAVVVHVKAVHKGHEYPPQTVWYAPRVGMVKWVMRDELEEVLISISQEK